MSDLFQAFVHDSLDQLGAARTELGSGGVWRAELPPPAARFLGRTQADLLYTFDLTRWEQGARLECLTRQSPLVARLQAYALGVGAVAAAHMPQPGASYHPYLLGRFAARYTSDQDQEETQWLGIHIPTARPIKVKYDPFEMDGLEQGKPDSVGVAPSPEKLKSTLEALAETWNHHASQKTRLIQSDLERRYKQEAAEITSSKSGAARAAALRRIADRLQLTVECRLQMALVLWMPS